MSTHLLRIIIRRCSQLSSHIQFWTRLFIGLGMLFSIPQSQAADPLNITSEWGGHIRAIGTHTDPDDQSIYQFTDDGPFFDRQGELRLNHQLFIGEKWAFETHYELVGRQGDTLKNNNRLRDMLPDATADRLVAREAPSDNSRLMNLTRPLNDGRDHIVYHRLDRLNLTYTSPAATLRLGRQALTWGNGLIFNPMDIFNPFEPTSVQKDYKVGEDMAHLQLPMGQGEVQLLYLPRRNPETGDISEAHSSAAGKWHFPVKAFEMDLMAARHFEDAILGIGATGYLGGAAWRGDVTYTHLDDDTTRNDFWQVVLNMDYAWQWGGKNLYGLLEFYYNGLGEDQDYAAALADPTIASQISRGERFTLGRTYLAGQIQLELHPLLQFSLLSIVNPEDPSGVIRPQFAWDAAANLQLIIGAGFNWGGSETEFGGFNFSTGAGTVKVSPSDSRYLWLTYYF